MNALEILDDAASRPAQAALQLRDRLTAESLNARLGEQDNSVAWLLWHTGREIDVQLAALSGIEEVWAAGGFAERTGIGAAGEGIGYGHTPEQARAIRTEDAGPLLAYLVAATDALRAYIRALDVDALDEVIDSAGDPPVTRGVRLVSIIDDAAQHVGQAAFALGAFPAG